MPIFGLLVIFALMLGWVILETVVLRETRRDAMRRLVIVLLAMAYVVLLGLM